MIVQHDPSKIVASPDQEKISFAIAVGKAFMGKVINETSPVTVRQA